MTPKSTTKRPGRGKPSLPRSSAAAARPEPSDSGTQDSLIPIDWKPEPYQLDGVKFLLDQPQAALLLDPGYRKTSIVLAAFKLLKQKGVVSKLLVVGTPRICGRSGPWQQEVRKWRDFAHLRVVNLHGPKKDRLLAQDADIYLVSYEGLEWLFDVAKKVSQKTGKVSVVPNFARVKKLGVDMLALDEVSKVKSHTAQRSKVVFLAQDHFHRIVSMTGSPQPNGMEDLFGIMLVTDGGYSLGRYITHYRNNYFHPTGYGGYDWQLNEGAREKIYEKVAPFTFRLDSEHLVKIPKLVTNVVTVGLPDEARRMYDELEEEFITEVQEKGLGPVSIVAQNSGGAFVKCAQLANGGIFKPSKMDEETLARSRRREWLDVHYEKVDAVVALVEELGSQPALIVYDFAHDLARLQAALGKDFHHIGSGVTARRGDELISLWNRGKLPGLLVHPASLSHGINMQENNAQHVIWHSLTTNYEWYDQLIRRLRRSGNSAEHVTAHLIVAKNTVDEIKLASLRRKKGEQGQFLDAMRDYTDRRLAALRSRRGASKK
jgi:SNF2 family DNA or RNA helicase